MRETLPSTESKVLGLLPHEAAFVTSSLVAATKTRRDALRLVGGTVEDTGGDWAFDDSATRMASEHAALTDANLGYMQDLANHAGDVPASTYPEEEDTAVRAGSRVTITTAYGEEVYDVATHRIKGMPQDDDSDVQLVSAQSPLGKVLLGESIGSKISWLSPNGKELGGTIVSIDQVAQRQFYSRFIQARQ